MHLKQIKKLTKYSIAMGAIATMTIMSGCTTTVETPYVADWKPVTPKIATLLDSGKTIRAVDGSFTLVGGGEPINISKVTSKVLLNTSGLDLDDYKKIISGRPSYNVRVKVPGMNEELYGILSFYSVGSTADSTALRAWRITIPDEAITQAQGGGLSFSTGDYMFKGNLPTDTSEKWKSGVIWSDVGDKVTIYHPSRDRKAISWVLWLSDYPLVAN